MNQPAIVFCTTCKGRLQHLEQTLPRNLKDNAGYANCKFVVLDYNSQDGLADYMARHFLRGGLFYDTPTVRDRVAFYRYLEPGAFRVAHAKNLAARCGIREGADILVTLDADNYTGPGFAQFIADEFQASRERPGIFLCPDFRLIHSLPHGPERPHRGYAGRLAIRAQDFVKAGGYDEEFHTWRGEDTDMIFRLERMGYTARRISNGHLGVIPHDSATRFKDYPEAQRFEDKQEIAVLEARGGTVVNHGRFGLGTVFRNFDFTTPIHLEPLPTRIFGIGLQKTATNSLHRALQILGYDSLHWGSGEAPMIWQEMSALGRSRTIEQWYAVSDLPIPLLYGQLDRAYPGSKFILTVRDERKWLRSVQRFWDPRYNPTRHLWDVYPISNTLHKALYGRIDFDAQTFLATYRKHNAEVREYFKDRPGDLLVMNMDDGAGWCCLCPFLKQPVPAVPYPTEMRTTTITKGMTTK
jgi:hypothetical protein